MFFKVPMIDGGKVDDEWEFGETNGSDGDLEYRNYWSFFAGWFGAGSILLALSTALWCFGFRPVPKCVVVSASTEYRYEFAWVAQDGKECGRLWRNTDGPLWHAQPSGFFWPDKEFTEVGNAFRYMNEHCAPMGPYAVQIPEEGKPVVEWNFRGDKVHPRADK